MKTFYHYKDRNPIDTIKIIQNFFINNGFNFKINIENPINNIWWCQIILFYKNYLIISTNGKGITKDLALASGYAELYERFCNKQFFFTNPIIQNLITQNKKCSIEEYLKNNNDITLKSILNQYCNNDIELIQKFFYSHCGENIICDDFINLLNEEIKQYNIPITRNYLGSTGLAAGNTLEEALVQGISEVCERYTYTKLLQKYNINKIKRINIDILPDRFKNIINSIKKNNKIFLFDFSYILDMPVIGLIIYSFQQNRFFINCGSHPVFEIALERCLTEMYQGEFSDKILINQQKWISYKNTYDLQFRINFGTTSKYSTFFPEEILYNTTEVNYYNKDIFLPNNKYDNLYLLNYFKKYFIKNNIDIYYKDTSLINDIKSITILCPNLKWSYAYPVKIFEDKELNTNKINTGYYYYQYLNSCLNDNLNDDIIHNLIKLFKNNRYNFDYINDEYLFPLGQYDYLSHNLLSDFVNNINQIYSKKNNDLYPIMTLYNFICEYIVSNKYSNKETLNIFKTIDLNIPINDIELIRKDKDFYLLKYIIPPIIKQNYTNENFIHIMKMFNKN